MKKYFFLLGTNPELSFAELESVFAGEEASLFSEQIAQVKTAVTLEPGQLIARLGGTVKIFQFIQNLPKNSSAEQIEKFLVNYLSDLQLEKIKLGIGEIGRDHLPKLDVMNVKRGLETYGTKVRFLEGSRIGLGAAILSHQRSVQEYCVIEGADKIAIARTLAVQDIDDWTNRDRNKPYSDRKKGMLPPKLARIMLGLAVGPKIWQADNQDLTVYDPFCGSATVLMEAALNNFSVAGSDLDVKAILGSGENLQWLADTYKISVKQQLVTSEVSKVKVVQLGGAQVDYLVTEPFLGKPTPRAQDLPGIFRGLEKMYLGAFKNWTNLLKKGATVVMVWPRVQMGGKEFTMLPLLDRLKALGYTMSSLKPQHYSRPGAIVEREIVKLKFN